jgi:hypothetical protein
MNKNKEDDSRRNSEHMKRLTVNSYDDALSGIVRDAERPEDTRQPLKLQGLRFKQNGYCLSVPSQRVFNLKTRVTSIYIIT